MNGMLLNNRYQIKDIIGTGGMAIVYDGFDNLLSRKVAIKILKESFSDNEDFIDRLKIEAINSASLSDENIVNIYDVGNTEINGKNIEFIIMEKVEGKTLKEIIQNEAPLSADRILNYANQIAKALQTAHLNGIVHRDIKPANILITKNDKVKVADFGIARVSSDATLTYTSSILGTVHYISPEQAKGQTIDSRSDLYSLGVLLYEMATSHVPFDGESPVSIAVKHIQELPQRVDSLNPNINNDFSLLIAKLLQKNPEDRYKTVSNLISDLNKLSNGENLKSTLKLDGTQIINSNNNVKAKYKSNNNDGKIIINRRTIPKWLMNTAYVISGILFLIMIYGFSQSFINHKLSQNEIIMPSVVGVNEEDARAILEEKGLFINIKDRIYDPNISKGNIISQSISAQSIVNKGDFIDLTVSKGKELVKVPNIIGYDINSIEKILSDYGLIIGNKTYEESGYGKDTVIQQTPASGEEVEIGSEIDLIISSGKTEEKVVVPNVENQDQSIAIKTITSSGLITGNITKQYSEDVKENAVISQSIHPGQKILKGTKIDIVISIGKETFAEIETETETETELETKVENNIEKQLEIKSETITETTNVNKNETPQNNIKEFVFKLNAPSTESDTFNVKIYNITRNNELVYDRNINKSEIGRDGTISISIKDTSDSKFEVEYDGKKAQIN